MQVRLVGQDQLSSMKLQENRDSCGPGSERLLAMQEKDQPCLVHVIVNKNWRS
jgi:hypothetical protein